MTCGGDRGVVSVSTEHGDQAAVLSSGEGGCALVLFDVEGEPKTSLP
jgi:hypothetical protein